MSEQDRFDWSDDADFESLADEPIEGFADFDDDSDYDSLADEMPLTEDDLAEGLPEPAADEMPEPAAEAAPEPVKAPSAVSGKRGRGISSGELAFVFSASTLVAAAGIGSASLLAVGVNPATLWQPDKLLTWQNYFNLESNPLNILALICLGVVALTLLGSRAIAKAASGANNRTRAAEEMLDRVTSLRLEDEAGWQDPAFKTFAPAATFAAETLGAWRLQGARQKRLTGLEGEMRRLEKALADNSRDDLTGRFDNPAVGTLADEMLRYFDERKTLSRELKELREKDQVEAKEIIQILQDARCWHDASEKNLGLQGAAVDRLAARLKDVADHMNAGGSTADASAVFASFKAEFDRIRVAAGKAPNGDNELTDLVDKGSKLAFQIAMEVARLGPRGERLVPMSQSLEDLTTEFRAAVDRTNAESSPGQQWADSLERLGGKLAEMEQAIKAGGSGGSAWQQQVQQCGPAAQQLASNLAEIVQSYSPQAERLTNLGLNFSSFADTEFDAADLSSGNPENPPAGVLNIEGRTPFNEDDTHHNADSIHQPADVDPFAVTPQPQVIEAPADPDFSSSVGEPTADIFGSGMDRSKLPDLEIEPSFGVKRDQPAAGPQDEGAGDEKVYDLGDFGAAPAAVAPAVTPPQEEEVYEMADLGATPVTAEPAGEDPVYDLAELGAVSLDSPAADDGEKVFDLAEFGAVPLG